MHHGNQISMVAQKEGRGPFKPRPSLLRYCVMRPSIVELQSELDLPAENTGSASRALEQAESAPNAGVGRIQYWRVEEVDRFTSELHLEAFAKVEELGRAGVHSAQPRTAHGGHTASAKRARVLRPEVGRIEPLIAA